jgi:hypothetical protein
MFRVIHLSVIAAVLTGSSAVHANGLNENTAWQFQTTAEMANRAYIEDLRRKQQSGFYNSPVYNSFIDNQNNFNCSNAANASGNAGTNSTTANTPNSSGATGSATGNSSSASTSAMQQPYETVLNNAQRNSGLVASDVMGDTVASSSNNLTRQVLNSAQDNLGVQDASVNGSNACAFDSITGVSK